MVSKGTKEREKSSRAHFLGIRLCSAKWGAKKRDSGTLQGANREKNFGGRQRQKSGCLFSSCPTLPRYLTYLICPPTRYLRTCALLHYCHIWCLLGSWYAELQRT